MKLCNINPTKSQTSILSKDVQDIKSKLWDVIHHPVSFVEPKAVVLKKCTVKACLLKNGGYAYALGLPIFGQFHYSNWYTL